MRKNLVVTVIVALLAVSVLGVGVALASDAKADPTATYQKWVDLRKEYVQKQVDAGLVTPEQGKYMIDQLDLAKKYTPQGYGPTYGPGFGSRSGCFGYGSRACSFGAGYPGSYCGR